MSRRTAWRANCSPLHIRGVDLHIKRYCFSYGIGRVSGFAFYSGVQVRREAATVPDIRPILRVPWRPIGFVMSRVDCRTKARYGL